MEQVNLPERTKVHLQIREPAAGAPAPPTKAVSAQKAAMQNLLDWVQDRPESATGETVSARDYDRVVYGCPNPKESLR